MNHRFDVGEIVTRSKCSFFRNRMADSYMITGLLPKSVAGYSYRMQGSDAEGQQIALECDLSSIAGWELARGDEVRPYIF